MDLAKIPPATQLQPIDLVTPGFRGLNTVQAGSVLSPAWATIAQNSIIDSSGRLAARDGFTDVTTTPIDPAVTVRTIFEYVQEDGDVFNIVAYSGGISSSLTDPEGSDISGAVTDTDGTWWFQNFNNFVIGFQNGQTAIVWNGTGNFAAITPSSGTVPNGGIGLAAFGRVWGLASDKQTIRYSGLLDHTDWGGAGAGSIDMSNVWVDGTDEVTALRAFNGQLVVFGKKHIIFFGDGNFSILGMSPTNMAVTDAVVGTGCVSQWSIQSVGETDLLFLSRNGVQSIKRVIQERSNPINTLTKYVRDGLLTQLMAETPTLIRSVYNPLLGAYLLSFPTSSTTWVLDQRRRFVDEDGTEVSVVTTWDVAPTALLSNGTDLLYAAVADGYVSRYAGDTDRGDTFRWAYRSPWLDLGEDLANRIKILKRLGAILLVQADAVIVFKWGVDFKDQFRTLSREVAGDTSAEFGTGEFGEDEFSGALALRILKVPARHKGQYLRIGLEADVRGELAMQQAELFAKIGRLA
jgi:hypothetical protein